MEMNSLPTAVPLTKEQIDSFTHGTLTLYFYGNIRYDDIFGNTHETNFCLFVAGTGSQLITCNNYNDSN